MAKADSVWSDAERQAWATSRYPDLVAWAEANYVLPQTDPGRGPFDSALTPYIREPLRAISAPWVHEITIPAGAQLCKTTIQLLMIAWTVHESPAECMFLMGRKEDAESLAVDRLRPIMEASPNLAALVRNYTREVTKKKISVGGARIYFDTATSPAAVSSRPIERACADELHLHPETIKGEGAPYDLLKQRCSNFLNWKLLGTSTPTNENAKVWQLYLQGTQHVWHNRCIHCRELYVPAFSQIKIPDGERDPARIRDLRLAWYECPHCGGKIGENQKHDSLSGGAYLARNQKTDHPSHMSFWISGIASPWRTFSAIIAQFLECKDSPEKLRVFHNLTLGENFNDRVATINISTGDAAGADAHPRGILPPDVQLLTAGADCHGDKKGFYWSVWGWGTGRRGWLIDYGQVFSWADLEHELTGRDWHTADGRVYLPQIGVDSGFDAPAVYEHCRDRYPQWRPTKGEDYFDGPPTKDSPVDYVDRRRGVHFKGFSSLRINTNYFKDDIAHALAESEDSPRRLFLPAGDNAEFIRQMQGEHKIRKPGGREAWVKRYDGSPNHYLDTAVIARAVAYRFGLTRLIELPDFSKPEPAVSSAIPRPDPRKTNIAHYYASQRRR